MTSLLTVRPLVEIARRFLKASYSLVDSRKENILYIQLNSEKAYIEYEVKGNVYHLHYTYVPKGYEGAGIGKMLAEKAFNYIATDNKKMFLSCEFLMHYYEKNKNKYEKYCVTKF